MLKVFLFDEPLRNLDVQNFVRNLRYEIKKLHRDLGNTMIYVTHDQIEANDSCRSHCCNEKWRDTAIR